MNKQTKQKKDISAQILEQVAAPIMAVDLDMNIISINKKALNLLGKKLEEVKGMQCADIFKSAHCNTDKCCMRKAIEKGKPFSARNEATVDGETVPIEYFAVPLKNDEGEIIGGIEYIVDISELVLNEERVREQSIKIEERLREQAMTIQETSTPTIQLWEGILVMPVIGVVDSNRAQQMMEKILEKIISTSAQVMILDISGVTAVDTAVANHLIKIAKATKLMGCLCIISGVSPAVAQTIVHLGVDMGSICTKSTLCDALGEAFKYNGIIVK